LSETKDDEESNWQNATRLRYSILPIFNAHAQTPPSHPYFVD